MEEDTKLILTSISSLQTAKLENAYQSVLEAMDDLGIWVEDFDRWDDHCPAIENLLQVPAVDSVDSTALKEAMKSLREAKNWANVVFNDKNCPADID